LNGKLSNAAITLRITISARYFRVIVHAGHFQLYRTQYGDKSSPQKSFFFMQDLWSDIDEDQQSVCLQVNARVGERANQQFQDVLRATMWLTASVPALGITRHPFAVSGLEGAAPKD
jgi:hypothetical protein